MTHTQRNTPLVHGTPEGYNNWMCRCAECSAAAAVQRRKTRDKAKARSFGHGTPAMFVERSCRCAMCKRAMAEHAAIKKGKPTKQSLDEAFTKSRRLAQELSNLAAGLSGTERRIVGQAELRQAEVAELLWQAYREAGD